MANAVIYSILDSNFLVANWKMYLLKLQNVFVKIVKSICQHCKIDQDVFVQIFIARRT